PQSSCFAWNSFHKILPSQNFKTNMLRIHKADLEKDCIDMQAEINGGAETLACSPGDGRDRRDRWQSSSSI
ncbi:MAG: hypothetical protein KKG78_09610, partial [Alphaproteobacteria bacterium]|nr:hypothetical protein [Alphaproteobacteria bacterium]